MRFDLAFLLTALATSTTSRVIGDVDTVKANSKAGKALMSKARRLDNNEDEVDYSWLPGYSFKFEKCYSWDSFGREEQARQESYVVFRACPQGACSSSCRYGAEYIVEMREYVEAYTQAKENLQEYNCNLVEENCACDDDQVDDNTCLANCYAASGLSYCQNNEDGDGDNNNNNENNWDEYDDCKELEMNNDDDGNNAVYYAMMYCANGGKSINLGVFTDEECTVKDTSNSYKAYYGSSLPYSSKSIIGSGCVSCMNPYYEANDGYDDQNDEDQVNEMCMELYEQAGKCETHLKIDNPTTSACNYIHNVVPSMEKLFEGTKMAPTSTLTVFFGAMCLVLLGVSFYFFKHQKTTNINLSDQGGVLT